ncbi:MAG TPA: low molecular weight phosphatase family protein [Candidatus Saccharimonadales bacterium]|nr:low molecular weight phosphatase family protein [Candidatus Saccharimonadales bacterium]
MKVLFVCTQNVGRSQMAAALYNSLAADGHADAAGTRVDEPGQRLADRAHGHPGAQDVLSVMREDGLDLSHKTRHAVSKEMLDGYDHIIVMAEPDTIPDYLRDHPRAVYWDIPDPRFDGIDAARGTRDELKRRIVELLG